MAKFYGMVGYAETKETSPGVWEDVITPRPYFGDVLSAYFKVQNSENLNDDLNISNRISILADTFANANFHAIRYVEHMGVKWKVKSIEVLYPRLILSIGGVYNA